MSKFSSRTSGFILMFLVLISNAIHSQSRKEPTSAQLYKQLQLVAADSLKGFDENIHKVQALNDGFLGDEFYVFMWQRMREFINNKYQLEQQPEEFFGAGNKGPGGNQINAAPCVNEDFEQGNFNGWTVSRGVNSGNCNILTPNAGSPEAWIRTTPWPDPNFPGNVPNSPLGGTRIAQLNNNAVGNLVTRIAQTFPVTGNNALFQFAYCAVFNGAHSCCQRPFLRIDLLDCSNNVLACPQISVIAPGGVGCGPATPGFTTSGTISKCLWQVKSIDLTPYIGTCVTIRVTVGDCSGGAHQGYCYFDSKCMPMDIAVNNVLFPAGVQALTVSACGQNSATVSAPPGLQPYNWNGPPGSGIVNNPNQTFTTQTAGTYTLVMNPVGSCSPTVKYVTLNFAPSPTAGVAYSNQCNVFTFTNTGGPAPLTQSFTFAGPSPPPSFTTANNTNTVTFNTPGTYTVTQVVTNTAGCTASTQVVITAPVAPNVNFNINNPVQCLTGNSFNFTAADPAGTHSYSFSPNGPTGNTPNYGPVSFTAAGTYTVVHSVTAMGCTTFSTNTIQVNPQPVATASNSGPVCVGAPVYFTAGGGTGYNWNGPLGYTAAVQNPTINNALITMSGNYSVVVTDANGCTAVAVTSLNVYALPSPSITSNSPVCQGGVLTMTASGGANYSWTGPNGFTSNLTSPQINNVSLAASGIYTLLAGSGNCTVSTTASLTINPLPVVNAGSNSTVCTNQNLLLTSGGGTAYTWSGPGNYISGMQNPTIAAVQGSNAGVYTVTATDGNGCVNSNTTDVVVAPLPVMAVNHPTACPNSTLNFTSGGAASYAWSGPNNYASNQQNPSITGVQVNMTGQYTVVGTSADGCTNTAISTAVVFPSPVPNINTNSPLCFGATLTLSGSGGNQYSWTGPNNFTSSQQNDQIANVSLLASGDYSLLVTSANSCTEIAIASVTVNPLPSPAILSNAPLCAGEVLTFTAQGGSSYTWSGPNNFTSSNVSDQIANATQIHSGVYTLTATDANNCQNSTTANLVVKPLPTVNAIGSTVCIGATASLNIVTDAVLFAWNGPSSYSSSLQNPQIINLAPNQVGNYTVLVTAANQCTAMAVATLSNHPVPQPVAANSGPVCLNQKVNFSASGGLVYSWYGPNGFIADTQNPSLESANSTNYSGTYTVNVIDEKGCQGSGVTNLLVRPNPTALLNTSANNFCVPFCATFTATSASPLQNLKWQLSDGTSEFTDVFKHCFTRVGAHVLSTSYKDVHGCPGSSSMIVNAYPVPVADFHYGPGAPVENDEVLFTDASMGEQINGWSWYFASNNNISLAQNPSHFFKEPGTYPVAMIVTNKWGCKDTIVKPVQIREDFNIYVPNAFTPNADGVNDVFQPKGYGIKKYSIMIFDRWGEKLFATDDFMKGWDGTFKGQICKEDTYTWKINVEGGDGKTRELTGIVTLLR